MASVGPIGAYVAPHAFLLQLHSTPQFSPPSTSMSQFRSSRRSTYPIEANIGMARNDFLGLGSANQSPNRRCRCRCPIANTTLTAEAEGV